MKVVNIDASYSWAGNPVLMIELDRNEKTAADEALKAVRDNPSAYELKLVKTQNKRSLEANNYAWALMGKLAAKLKVKTKMDVYRGYVRECGPFEIVPIREDAIKRWVAIWAEKGDGFVCDDMGECRNTKGYHNIRCYYGSHTYTKQEMGRFIDMIVADCKEQGIETMTPAELADLKNRWEEHIK